MERTDQSSLWVATLGHRFPDASIEAAALEGSGVKVCSFGDLTEDAALAAARDADVVLLGTGMSLDAQALRSFRRCRAVVRYGVGVDNVDLAEARRLGIVVCNVPDYGIEEVANHAIAFLLLFARRMDLWAEAVRARRWGGTLPRVRLLRLSRATLGVIGVGRIGQAVLARAQAIWGRVLASDPNIDAGIIRRLGARPASLEELLAQSDFITVHVPLSPATKGLLSAERLRLLKSGAVLVNCSRGEVIDEEALAQRITDGSIAGAGLDVFSHEPPSPQGIICLPQVWPTPHVAWLSEDAIIDLRRGAAQEARRILLGEAPLNPIKPFAE